MTRCVIAAAGVVIYAQSHHGRDLADQLDLETAMSVRRRMQHHALDQ